MNAVVTGGSGGLGTAIARGLREAGARVVSADLAASENSRDSRQPGGCDFVSHDVCSAESWSALAKHVRRHLGRLDILVNNAGVSARSDLLTTTDDEWEHILRTNLWGPWTGIRVFIDDLTASPHAAVVNIGSIYGVRPPPGAPAPPSSVAYQASKAGLHMLTRSAAVELSPRRVRVNAVLPGVVATPLLADLTDDQRQARVVQAPMARAGTSVDVAHATTYLASPRASFVTGTLFPVDGGCLAT